MIRRIFVAPRARERKEITHARGFPTGQRFWKEFSSGGKLPDRPVTPSRVVVVFEIEEFGRGYDAAILLMGTWRNLFVSCDCPLYFRPE